MPHTSLDLPQNCRNEDFWIRYHMKRAFKIGTTSNRKRAKVIAVRIYTSTLYMLLHSEERGMHGQRWYIGASYLVTILESVGTRSTLNFELRPNHSLKWTELHPTYPRSYHFCSFFCCLLFALSDIHVDRFYIVRLTDLLALRKAV